MPFKKTTEQLKKVCRIFYYTAKRYADDENASRAVTLTYYTLFAIVPIAALLFGIAKGFSFEQQFNALLSNRLAGNQQFDYIISLASKTLEQASGGLVAGIGIIALFWTVMWLIIHIEKSFNTIWELPARRNLWHKFNSYLALLLLTPILLVITGTADVMIQKQLDSYIGKLGVFDPMYGIFLEALSLIAPALIVGAVFVIIYFLAPNTKVRFKYAFFAGLFASIVFLLLQNGFVMLQKWVFTYNGVYGSFAALPLFLIWLNWSWAVVLFGAELCFVSQNFDSGIFENRTISQMSLKLRREHQLLILSQVFNKFNSPEGGALPETYLALTLRLPETLLRSEIDELIASGLLCRTVSENDSGALLPGVQPDSFTIADFFERIHGAGDTSSPLFAKCDKLLNAITADLKNSPANKRVKEL